MTEGKKEKIAAIVVTYNRKDIVGECLNAILNQTRPVDAIYIIDNASIDGTPEYLLEKGLIDKPLYPDKEPLEKVKTIPIPTSVAGPDTAIEIHYVRMHENTGGAGAFHEGIKRCYEAGFDRFWLMDDDGIPSESQLSELLIKSAEKNLWYCGPLVINKDDAQTLAFRPHNLRKVKNSTDAIMAYAEDGVIYYNWTSGFNGTLISKEVVEKIGNIKKEMFIWGDDLEYELRAKANNIKLGTIIDALHRHPPREGVRAQVLFGLLGRVIVRPADKAFLYYRNLGYINAKYHGITQHLKKLTKHTVFYLINQRLNIKGLTEFYRYYFDGATDRYSLPPKRK